MRSRRSSRLLDPWVWVEVFVLVNFAALTLDIYLAHSVNEFRRWPEYIPLYFSMGAPVVLLAGLLVLGRERRAPLWLDPGFLVGWAAVLLGLVGMVLHLDSHFFLEKTLRSLVYSAPFAAPLAYTGLGLLLIMNRLVDPESLEWGQWVTLLALGGFLGNFVFSLTDHAQIGFVYETSPSPILWIPVVSSAFAVGFLAVPFLVRVDRRFLAICAAVLVWQALVGLLGFYYHLTADLHGPSRNLLDNVIHGAPLMAPLLFPNLVLLAFIGVWVMSRRLPETAPALPGAAAPAEGPAGGGPLT
jgi:hypothetical protein